MRTWRHLSKEERSQVVAGWITIGIAATVGYKLGQKRAKSAVN